MRVIATLLTGLLVAAAPQALAEIYKWTDENGQVHYTQQPPPEGSAAAADVEVLEDLEEGGVELPPRAREAYCADVAELGRRVAAQMRQGATLSSVRASARRSPVAALANAVVSEVWDERTSDSSPAAIASRVHTSCMDGDYARYVESYWAHLRPGRPLPGSEDAADGPGLRQTRAGTGWAIGPHTIVTSHHLVAGSEKVTVVLGRDDRQAARVVDVDEDHDLARLRLADPDRRLRPLPVSTEPAPLGAKVLTIGYPHVSVMGRSPKVTTGVISARAGPRDDERLYQISAPIQAGNSGGPLLNERGEVVGVVVGKLDADAIYRASGDRPQNVAYAIKSAYLGPWATGAGGQGAAAEALETEALVSRVQDSVVLVVAR